MLGETYTAYCSRVLGGPVWSRRDRCKCVASSEAEAWCTYLSPNFTSQNFENKTKHFDNYTVVIASGEYKTKDKLALSTLKKAGKRYEIKTGVTANDIHE